MYLAACHLLFLRNHHRSGCLHLPKPLSALSEKRILWLSLVFLGLLFVCFCANKCLSFGLYWFNGYTFNGNYCQWLSKDCCWNPSNRDLCSVGHYCHLTVFGLTVFCFYWHSSLSFIGKEKVSAGATSLVICCLFSLWCFVS